MPNKGITMKGLFKLLERIGHRPQEDTNSQVKTAERISVKKGR